MCTCVLYMYMWGGGGGWGAIWKCKYTETGQDRTREGRQICLGFLSLWIHMDAIPDQLGHKSRGDSEYSLLCFTPKKLWHS